MAALRATPSENASVTSRLRTLLVLAIPVICVVSLGVTVALDVRTPLAGGPLPVVDEPGWPYALNGVLLGGLALLVLRHDPRHGFGWAMGGLGVFWAFDAVAQAYVRVGLSPTEAFPAMTFALWFLLRFTSLLPVVIAVMLVVFPTGRFPAGRWGTVGKVGVAALTLPCLGLVVAPGEGPVPIDAPPGVDLSPTGIAALGPLVGALAPLARPVAALGFVAAMSTVVVRYRHSRGLERDRMRWLLWAVIVMTAIIALTTFWSADGVEVLVTFLVMVMPAAAMTVAIVRPDLVAIDLLFSRTLLYASLGAVVVAIDLAMLAGITAVLGDALDQQQSVLLVLLLTALIYAPLRDRLRTGVRRLVLGDRDDPYDVVAGLASTLEATDDAPDQLAAVATAVATAFGVGYVRVEVDRSGGERVVATHGTAPDETRTLPITYRDEEVGRLVLPARGLRSRLTERDERLLGDLVRQAATAARTSRLAAELQESRERLVVAREEERRRIRRDLHDGLGPALSGVVFRLESARLLVARDPDAAAAQIEATTGEVQEVVADVRRLVHDLRPPALDDRGLSGALDQLAEGLSTDGLAVTVDAEDLDTLPAAVEVAAYRIAAEALTNVARHASASRAVVRLVRDPAALIVEVTDDGRGIEPAAQAGVGMVSLRERAAELGGTTEVTCPPAGGTVVRARLPLGAPHD